MFRPPSRFALIRLEQSATRLLCLEALCAGVAGELPSRSLWGSPHSSCWLMATSLRYSKVMRELPSFAGILTCAWDVEVAGRGMVGTLLFEKRAFSVGACLGGIMSRSQGTFHPIHACWVPEGDLIWTHRFR